MPVTMPDPDIACGLLGATLSWPASALTEGDKVVSPRADCQIADFPLLR
jgi:hypothetical protein